MTYRQMQYSPSRGTELQNVTPHSLNQHSFDVYSYTHLDLAQNYNGFFPASEAWEWFKLVAYLLVVE